MFYYSVDKLVRISLRFERKALERFRHWFVVDGCNGTFRDNKIDFRTHRRFIIFLVFREIIDEKEIVLVTFYPCTCRRTLQFIQNNRMEVEFLLQKRKIL